MLATDEDDAPFLRTGFSRLAELIYLKADRDAFPTVPPDRLSFECPGTDDEPRFRQLLEATYQNTMDCPEVHRMLDIESTLASYRGQGGYDPRLWFVARDDDRDVGCLILAAHSAELWELVYMGLVPAARGRGLGQELVLQALWLAGQRDVAQLALAVDDANSPARAIYGRLGFAPFDELAIYMRPLNPRGAGK